MARRVAELDYRVTGAETSASRVRTLSVALDQQNRHARAAVPAMLAAQRGTGSYSAVSAAASASVMHLAGAMGPLGAGLGMVALRAPLAARGLISLSVQTERLSILSRPLNMALLGGASAMAIGSVAAIGYAGAIVRGADAYTAMTARLSIFSEGSLQAAQNQEALYQSARDARTSVEALNTLFVRVTPAIDDMGRAQADALRVTELTSKALAIQGATTQETLASTIQFSQALASGVLRGDELRSMLESSPMLLRYIAQNLEIDGKVGVAFGQLRKLGMEGKLTAEALVDALIKSGDAIERDFINAPRTAQQAWQVLQDTVTRTVGQISTATGLQSGVFNFFDGLSRRLDQFRKDAILNPDQFDPAVRAAELLGGALETAWRLAGGVVENFDLIVSAGQAIIALKAGEVLASGFGLAAIKAREAYQAVQAFRVNAVMIAGSALDETGGAAAMAARQTALVAEARALDLKTQAEVKARMATAARAAADAASAEVTALKTRAGVTEAAVTQAEAAASALNTQAERAETAAKAATTAATNAQSAASARLAIAQEAELAVTRQVTNAQVAKAAVMRGLGSLYALLGGHVGMLTLVLGGLIYAIWQSKRAYDEKIRSMREAVDVSDELWAITQALTTATWAEIPALRAKAAAHRDAAAAAMEQARAEKELLRDRVAEIDGLIEAGMDRDGVLLNERSRLTRRIGDVDSVIADGDRASFAEREYAFAADTTYRYRQTQRAQDENRTGRDAAGREISAETRSANARIIQENRAWVATQLDSYDARLRRQEEAVRADPDNRALANGLTVLRRSWESLASLSVAANPDDGPRPATTGGGGGTSKVSAEERAIATILERLADAAKVDALMGRSPGGSRRFSVRDGQLYDGETPFQARSEDEARAAMAYLEQVEAITSANSRLVAETGLSREALMAQADASLEAALATSQASQAQERWSDQQATAAGESRAVAQAEREVAEARRQGAVVTDEAAEAYINLARARDEARRAEEALQQARPIVQDVTRGVLSDMGRRPQTWRNDTGDLGFDLDAALKDWGAASERIWAEVQQRILDEQQELVEKGLKTREQAEADSARLIAAARVAIEVENAEQVAEIWRIQRDEDAQAWEDRLQQRLDQERELSDNITSSLRDLAFGADPSDIGRRFAGDLMSAIWEELVTNPLNLMIRNWLRSLGSGTGAGGFWGSLWSIFPGGGFGGGLGGLGGGLGSSLSAFRGLNATPGFAGGGLPASALMPGLIKGVGGPREDRMLARVSPWEFISNARVSRNHGRMLDALNRGMSLTEALRLDLPVFAGGGLPGGLAQMMARDVLTGDIDRGTGNPTYAPGAPMVVTRAERPLQLNVINQTSREVDARQVPTAEGLDVILTEAVRGEVGQMGRDGSLAKAVGQAPKPRRRG